MIFALPCVENFTQTEQFTEKKRKEEFMNFLLKVMEETKTYLILYVSTIYGEESIGTRDIILGKNSSFFNEYKDIMLDGLDSIVIELAGRKYKYFDFKYDGHKVLEIHDGVVQNYDIDELTLMEKTSYNQLLENVRMSKYPYREGHVVLLCITACPK